MGLRCSFDIQDMGYDIATPQLGIEPDYSEGFEIFVETFLDTAQDLVPVDTGYLMSSIDASTDEVSVTCEADCEYAQYVEYGTYKMRAQPYFVPALEAALKEAKPAWDEAWEDALDEEQEELAEMEEESEEEEGGAAGFFGGLLGVVLGAIIVGLVRGFFDLLSGNDSQRNLRITEGQFITQPSEIESLVEIT